MKVIGEGTEKKIAIDYSEPGSGYALLMKAIGTRDFDFLSELLNQLGYASAQNNEANLNSLNFMLSVIKGIKPNDQIETMLAAQMAAVHMATMHYAKSLAHVETIPQQDSAERTLNKLTRTFATQMEALKRYRTGGEQKVTVQHVSVGEGGQAIVGNVTQTKSETVTEKPAASSPPALTHAKTPAMPIIDDNKEAVPVLARKKRQK